MTRAIKKAKRVEEAPPVPVFVLDRIKAVVGWLEGNGIRGNGMLTIRPIAWNRLRKISGKTWEELSEAEIELIYEVLGE